MGRLRKKRMHLGNKDTSKKFRVKRRTKDMDQIHDDLKPEAVQERDATAPDGDLPGFGLCYCIHCTKHFVDLLALRVHLKSKVHRRRLKELRVEPYTQAEAEAAAGVGQFIPAKKVDVPAIVGLAAQLAINELSRESVASLGGALGAGAGGAEMKI